MRTRKMMEAIMFTAIIAAILVGSIIFWEGIFWQAAKYVAETTAAFVTAISGNPAVMTDIWLIKVSRFLTILNVVFINIIAVYGASRSIGKIIEKEP